MPDLPIMLNVRGRRCVVIGGGPVALRRAGALLEAGAAVTVIAPDLDPAFGDRPVTAIRRAYQPGDLDGAWLAVLAADDPRVNRAAADEARRVGALVNRPDDPDAGDFTVPAHARHGPLTLAVHSGGVSSSAAGRIRRELSDALDPDWPRLLELAAPYRPLIQQRFADPHQRRDRLHRLTDADAMAMLKARGDEALRRYLEALSESA